MKENFANIPTGVLDTDSDLTQVSPENFVASLNMRQYPGEKTRKAIGGNELKAYTQPAGVNESCGWAEDKYRATGIHFVKNSNNNDEIRRFWSIGNRHELLLRWSGLNFSNKISETAVIDGRHLIWTDFNGSSGNQPRYIDMDHISLYRKKLSYELYWDSSSFGAGEDYSIQIKNSITGTVVLPTEVFFTATGDPDTDAESLAAALSGYDVDVDFCGNKIIVVAGTQERRIYITGSNIHFSPTNHYPETIIEPYISLIRMMPKQPPLPRFVNDPGINENKVFGFTFQFRYRYVYWNGSKSKWGPISHVPTNFISSGGGSPAIENSELYNKVVIGFDDELLDSQDWKAFVRRVEVAVRYEQTGPFKLVDSLEVADFGVTIHEVDFLNDGTYPEVESDENSESSIQALGNFDFVPRNSRALEVVQDETGRHLLCLYGNKEQYDPVDCVDAAIEQTLTFATGAPTSPTDQPSAEKCFKAGGVYDIFVIDEDEYGRQWPAIKLGRWNNISEVSSILGWVPGLGAPRVTINHQPPIESKRFRLAVSRNQNQGAYWQAPCFKVIYWTKDPHPTGGEGTFTSTTYGAGDADYVGFQFYLRDLDIDTETNFIFRDDNQSLLVQGGDRLHVVLDGEAGEFRLDDYLIEGYNLTDPAGVATGDRYTVFIKFDSSQPDYTLVGFPNTWHLIELYRPHVGGSDVPYEVGSAIDITDAGLPTRSYGPAITLSDIGDTYNYTYITKNYDSGSTPDIFINYSERPNLHKFKKEVGPDFGRASIEDWDYREVDAYDQIRHSGYYLPDTSINGFSSFRGTDRVRTRRDYGAAQSLQFCNGVLLAIGQFACQPIYVSKDRVMSLDGTTVGRTSRLLNIAGELDKMLGTHSPYCIVNTGKYVYGFDEYRGVPWRYSVGGGQDIISIGNVQLFRAIGREVFDASYKCIAGYSEEFEEYLLTSGRLRTMVHHEGRGWEMDASFVPDFYGRIGLRFFSLYQGNIWEHEKGMPCNFFGVQYQAYTTVVVNPQPQAVKLFWNFRFQGTAPWVPFANVPAGITPDGMETRILAAKFRKVEGQYWVDIPRDGTDPDPQFDSAANPGQRYIMALLGGRRMRGEVMTVQLQSLDASDGFTIKRLDTEWSPSMKTK